MIDGYSSNNAFFSGLNEQFNGNSSVAYPDMMSAEIYLPIDGISLEAADLTNSGISPTGLFTFFVYEKPTYIEVVPFFGDDSAFYNGGYIVPQGKLVHIKNVAQRYNISGDDIYRTILVKAPEWADFLPMTWGSQYDESLMHNLDLFFPEGWEIKAASNAVHHYYSVFIYEADKISEIFNSTNDNSLSSNYPEAIQNNSRTPVLFPNPTSSLLALNSDKEYDIEVYDMTGNKVMALTGNNINMEHLSTATYIVKATDKSNNEELTYKVVKN